MSAELKVGEKQAKHLLEKVWSGNTFCWFSFPLLLPGICLSFVDR